MARDVEITGRLEFTLEGSGTIDVVGHGSRLRCEIGDLVPKRPSLRLVRSSAKLARGLSRLLHANALTLTITRHGEPIAEIGAGVRGGPIARLFGLSRVRVYRKR